MHLTRRFRWFTVASLVIAPIGIGSVVSTVHAGDPLVEKNQMHFDSVLTELSGRDIGALTATQRSNRGTLVRELAAYSRRGVFPHNYDFPGRAVPYFVDRKTGTLCAVGNLLAFTGRRDVVDRVARANNNVWVDQLSADTAFAAWLDANGLTLHEAARIQLPYQQPTSNAQVARNVAYGITAPLAVLTSATTTLWNGVGNRDGHSRVLNWTGVVSGAAAIGSGVLLLQKPDFQDKFRTLGLTSAGIGALSMAISAHSIRRHGQIVTAEREAAEKKSVADAAVSPIVMTNGAAGVGVTVRF